MKPKLYKNTIIIVLLMLFLCLFGCRQEISGKKRLLITMMMEQFTAPDNSNDETWLSQIEEVTGTKIHLHMIPTLEYESQVERMIKQDKLPMVIAANDKVLDKEVLNVYLGAGGFWQLDDYLNDYPNLKAFVGEQLWERSQIRGHVYGIPRLRIMPRNGAYYRLDWADNLSLNPPETLSEISSMLKAFTEYDPDLNGLDDTVGLVNCWQSWGNRGWNGIQTITTALGGPNGWAYSAEKGLLIPDFAASEYMEMLKWFRGLYQNAYMEDSFAYLTAIQRQERFIQGKVGMIFGVIDDAPEMERQLREVNPEAKLAILPLIKSNGNSNYSVNSTNGYNGLIMFNRLGDEAIKTEEELRKVLSFYNNLCNEHGQSLLVLGNAGEQILPIPVYVRGEESKLLQDVYNCINVREQWLVWDDTDTLYSESYSRKGDELNRIIQSASIRYIMGEINEEDYWKHYAEWYQLGGRQIITEFTAAYLERIRTM